MIDTCQTPALGYLEVVQVRDAATLLLMIERHTRPNADIWSDQGLAYSLVATLLSIVYY